jgi:hypothetical protein
MYRQGVITQWKSREGYRHRKMTTGRLVIMKGGLSSH